MFVRDQGARFFPQSRHRRRSPHWVIQRRRAVDFPRRRIPRSRAAARLLQAFGRALRGKWLHFSQMRVSREKGANPSHANMWAKYRRTHHHGEPGRHTCNGRHARRLIWLDNSKRSASSQARPSRYELHALRGGVTFLQAAEVILTEVSFFAQAYEPPIAALVSFLSDNGFQLYDIASLSGRSRDNRLRQGDFIFVRIGSQLLKDGHWE